MRFRTTMRVLSVAPKCRFCGVARKSILSARKTETARRLSVRFIIALAFAAALLAPGIHPSHAAGATGLSAPGAWSDVSAAVKKKKPHKRAAKEQYLRAVPSTPPPATKR